MDVSWDTNRLRGPDDQDWRIPTSELEKRQDLVAKKLDIERSSLIPEKSFTLTPLL